MVNRTRSNKDRSSKSNKRRKSSFKYSSRDPKKTKERAERQGGNFPSPFKGGVDTWRPKDGDNQVRILPPTWEDAEHYGYKAFVHPFIGADSGTYLCLSKMKNKHCPICAASKAAKDDGDTDEAKQLQPREVFMCYVVDRDGDSEVPAIWSMSWSMDRDVAALCVHKKSGKVLEIDHPDEGYDISFKKVGKKLNTRYIGMAVDRDSSPLDEDEDTQAELLEFAEAKPIPECLKFEKAEVLEAALAGTAGEKDDDLDEDEDEDDKKSSKRKRSRDDDDDEDEKPRKPGKRRSRDEEEDEDEEDEDEEDDADEPRTRRSSKSKKSKSKRSRDEDEDEDDDPPFDGGKKKKKRSKDEDEDEDEEDPEDEDEEDEEDEKPARRSSKSKRRR